MLRKRRTPFILFKKETKPASNKKGEFYHADAFIGRGVKEQCISWKRDCDWKIRGRKESGDRVFYHGPQREQPQPDFRGGRRRDPHPGL